MRLLGICMALLVSTSALQVCLTDVEGDRQWQIQVLKKGEGVGPRKVRPASRLFNNVNLNISIVFHSSILVV